MKTSATIAGLLFALGLLMTWGGGNAVATSFAPTGYIVSVANTATSANSNISVDYTLDSPNSKAARHASLLPSAFGVATDAAIPNGAVVGSLSLSSSESQSTVPAQTQHSSGTSCTTQQRTLGTFSPTPPAIPSAAHMVGFTPTPTSFSRRNRQVSSVPEHALPGLTLAVLTGASRRRSARSIGL